MRTALRVQRSYLQIYPGHLTPRCRNRPGPRHREHRVRPRCWCARVVMRDARRKPAGDTVRLPSLHPRRRANVCMRARNVQVARTASPSEKPLQPCLRLASLTAPAEGRCVQCTRRAAGSCTLTNAFQDCYFAHPNGRVVDEGGAPAPAPLMAVPGARCASARGRRSSRGSPPRSRLPPARCCRALQVQLRLHSSGLPLLAPSRQAPRCHASLSGLL